MFGNSIPTVNTLPGHHKQRRSTTIMPNNVTLASLVCAMSEAIGRIFLMYVQGKCNRITDGRWSPQITYTYLEYKFNFCFCMFLYLRTNISRKWIIDVT